MNRVLVNGAARDWAVHFIAPDGCTRIGPWLLHESSVGVDALLAWGNIVHNRAEQSSLAASQVSTSTNGVYGDSHSEDL